MKKLIYSHGESSGIGPDLVIKLCKTTYWTKLKYPLIIVGDPKLFIDRANLLKKNISINTIQSINEAQPNKKNTLQILLNGKCKNTNPGKLYKSNVKYILDVLNTSINICIKNKYCALVTGPLSKENIIKIDPQFTGHTEHIQKLTKSKNVLMLLGSEKLKLAFITTHIPLQKVSNAINENAVFSKTKILDIELKKKFKIKNPRIGILGLNPHAGENGKIGSEEINKIAPAIKKLKSHKINITGPISADTAFTVSNRKKYDAFVAMYHDQALPVLKAISFGSGYNITLGVSIIRTSVDHGVALDIAGKEGLDYGSLQSAINLAQKII
ncbi:MAG: 4-hydroxythreonine-4-phosphate dehydrogenase PdxA [Gammaproteobacteria bacterium]